VKTLSPDFQAHLDSGATTICWCWKVVRGDGVVLGFTDHDSDVAFDGVTYEAASGFQASEVATSAGLNVDDLDVDGALQSNRLNERDLGAGLFDNAGVEIFAVNWQDSAQRVMLRKGNLGEITRGRSAFSAEIRGLAHHLNQPFGRIYQFGCDADLGDGRCGVDLEIAAHKGFGTVATVDDNARFFVTGIASFADQWFQRGKLTWTGGANAGRSMEVKSQSALQTDQVIELWQPMTETVASGDTFEIRAGCDKQFSTCRDKFANAVRFRGFPFMPGNDFVVSYPNRGEAGNDGGSRS